MKKVLLVVAAASILFGCACAVNAGSSFYGLSGLMETPDDTIAQTGSGMVSANFVTNYAGSDSDGSTYTAVFGILPKLEIGAAMLTTDMAGVDNQAIVNVKYSLLAETLDRPSVTLGCVDISNRFEKMVPYVDEASAFVMVGKNLTSAAEGVSGNIVKPVRGTLGIGTGIYRNLFGSLSMSVTPKFDIMVEYLGKGLRNESTLNGGLRFSPSQNLSISAGALDFSDLYVGANYSVATF